MITLIAFSMGVTSTTKLENALSCPCPGSYGPLSDILWRHFDKNGANTSPIKFVPRNRILAISQLRTAKHLWIVWRNNAKWQKTLKVKIRARNYKRCLIISKKKPQMLFALSVPRLMTGALYRTVPPNNPCMLCGLN